MIISLSPTSIHCTAWGLYEAVPEVPRGFAFTACPACKFR